MKKLEKNQIIGIAAIALGIAVVGKIVRDVKKIKQLTAEKEEALAEANAEQDCGEEAEAPAEDTAPVEETEQTAE